MTEEPAAMIGAHCGIILSQEHRPHQLQVVTSPCRLPPNLTEKLSPHSKSEDEQGTPWQALQACNVGIAFRRVPLKPTTKCAHRQSTQWSWGHVGTL